MIKKINRMHKLFGTAEGKCKNCSHYHYWRANEVCARPLRKCDVYGVTNSESSDWKASYDACGLFPDKPYNGTEVIKIRIKEPEQQIDGQISMF